MRNKKHRKTYIEKRKEEIDLLSEEELLRLEKKLYYSNGISTVIGLCVFLLCVVVLFRFVG